MSDPVPARPSVLAFHKLLDRFSYGANNYAPVRFERLLGILTAAGWHLASEVDPPSEEGRGLVVSFDDGYQHLAEVLPGLIDRYGLRPIVFVPTGLTGRPNSWDYSYRLRSTPHLDRETIRRLADRGVVFGSHGATHSDLTLLRSWKLEAELDDSRKLLQDLTNQEVASISYPFGRINERGLEAVQQAGYRRGYTMEFPTPVDQPLTLGRYPVYGFDTPWSVQRKLSHGALRSIERLKSATVSRLSGGTVLLNRLRRLSPG